MKLNWLRWAVVSVIIASAGIAACGGDITEPALEASNVLLDESTYPDSEEVAELPPGEFTFWVAEAFPGPGGDAYANAYVHGTAIYFTHWFATAEVSLRKMSGVEVGNDVLSVIVASGGAVAVATASQQARFTPTHATVALVESLGNTPNGAPVANPRAVIVRRATERPVILVTSATQPEDLDKAVAQLMRSLRTKPDLVAGAEYRMYVGPAQPVETKDRARAARDLARLATAGRYRVAGFGEQRAISGRSRPRRNPGPRSFRRVGSLLHENTERRRTLAHISPGSERYVVVATSKCRPTNPITNRGSTGAREVK
jgi:hypothetical protein